MVFHNNIKKNNNNNNNNNNKIDLLLIILKMLHFIQNGTSYPKRSVFYKLFII